MKAGLKFSIAYNSGNVWRQRLGEMIKMYLEMIAPGKIKVELVPMTWPSYLEAVRRGELPIHLNSFPPYILDPSDYVMTFFHSDGGYATRQGDNFKKFVSARIKELGGKSLSELIDMAEAEPDPEVRAKLYLQIQKFAIDNYINVPVYEQVGARAQRAWVKGFYGHPMMPYCDYFALFKQQ
ncbi:hypothetical protein [Fervidobacterium sp.]